MTTAPPLPGLDQELIYARLLPNAGSYANIEDDTPPVGHAKTLGSCISWMGPGQGWARVEAFDDYVRISASTSSATNGLVRRSWPKVEICWWPGTKVTSSPSGQSLPVIEAIRSG